VSLQFLGLFQFVAQFLFQMPARGFFNGAPFRRDCFLFSPSLGAAPRINMSRQVRNLWPTRSDLSFIRFRVRIHLVKNNTGIRGPLLQPASVMPEIACRTGIVDPGYNKGAEGMALVDTNTWID
jgi:hypothetical protein